MNRRHRIPEVLLGFGFAVAIGASWAVIAWVPSWITAKNLTPSSAGEFYTAFSGIASFVVAAIAVWQIKRSMASDKDVHLRFESQHRPWLSVELEEVSISRDREKLVLFLNVMNFGNVPAVDVELRAEVALGSLIGVFPGHDASEAFVRKERIAPRKSFDNRQLVFQGKKSKISGGLQIADLKSSHSVLIRYVVIYGSSDRRPSTYCTAGEVAFRPRKLGDDEEIYDSEFFDGDDYPSEVKFDAVERPTFRELYAD